MADNHKPAAAGPTPPPLKGTVLVLG
ncbi:MAG: hypothetical protein RLZZ182_127, partial [Pseudomonadota bacterium]